jgi:2-amino-4-hydroxy-6-hydroxymethyldihydropteridine diphosphokinase
MRVVLPAVIALGSNQGDREGLLREAVREIDALDGVRVTAASGIVETPALKPHGVDASAPSYLNAVVLASVALAPEELLAALHGIEARLGRVREEVWGDRTIDLDLVDFGGLRRENETITLPHPRAWERAFVLAVIGGIVVTLAVPIRRMTRTAGAPRVDPFYATRILMLAKACAVTGSLVAGVGIGVLAYLLTRSVIGVGSVTQAIAAIACAGVLLAGGLIGEHLCRVPPGDDDNDPGKEPVKA